MRKPDQAAQYTICIRGQIPERWAVWFEGLSITGTDYGETLICGPIADQSALHGLLAKIRDLNLILISVILDVEKGDPNE